MDETRKMFKKKETLEEQFIRLRQELYEDGTYTKKFMESLKLVIE